MTIEAAIGLTAIVATIVLCLGALLAASTQVRCVDAAREAARLAARGDRSSAVPAAARIAPRAADITVHIEGTRASAVVSSHTPLLPLLTLRAEAVATLEPGAAS